MTHWIEHKLIIEADVLRYKRLADGTEKYEIRPDPNHLPDGIGPLFGGRTYILTIKPKPNEREE